MELPPTRDQAGLTKECARLTEAAPYLRQLGLTVDGGGEGGTVRMTYSPELVGFEALHAGPVATLLEVAASLELSLHQAQEDRARLVTFTVEYLRPGRLADTFARAVIVKQGQRIANVRAEAWQQERARPIAIAQAVFHVGGAADRKDRKAPTRG